MRRQGGMSVLMGSIFVIVAIYLAWKFKCTNLFIDPISGLKVLRENLHAYLFASILFSVGIALMARTCLNKDAKSTTLLLFALLPSLTFPILFGMDISSVILMAGWVIFSVAFCREVIIEMEAYKKPRVYTIVSGSFKKAFLIFSIAAALSIYLFFSSNPGMVERVISTSMSQAAELSGEMVKGAEEAQKDMVLQMLNSVEGAFLMAASTQMSEECRMELQRIYPVVDNMTKSAIMREMESQNLQLNENEVSAMMMNQLKSTEFYQQILKLVPVLMAALTFFILEMIKSIILAPLSGVMSLALFRGRKRRYHSESASRISSKGAEAYAEDAYI